MKPVVALAVFAAFATVHAGAKAPAPASATPSVQVFASGRTGLKAPPARQVEEAGKRQELFCGRIHTGEVTASIPPDMEAVAPSARWEFDNPPAMQDAQVKIAPKNVTASGTVRHDAKPGAPALCGTAVLHLRFGLQPKGGPAGQAFQGLAVGTVRAGRKDARIALPASDDRVVEQVELAFEGAAKRITVPADASVERPFAFTRGARRYLAWRTGRELVLSDITK